MMQGRPAARPISVILWGQSLGAAVAVTTAAAVLNCGQHGGQFDKALNIKGLILETPFTSIKGMLLDLYSQRWLPYRYLYPFLWNHWDSIEAIGKLGTQTSVAPPSILLMQAAKDELVTCSHCMKIRAAMKGHNLKHDFVCVPNAFHTNVIDQKAGRDAIARFINRTLHK